MTDTKLHKPIVQAICQALVAIFQENRYADKVLERLLKQNSQWGSRDRRLIAETTYDVVRNFRALSYLTGESGNYYDLLAVYFHEKGVALPEWPEFRNFHSKQLAYLKKNLNNPAISESYPDWLCNLGIAELGETQWWQEAHAMNEPAKVVLRTNTLKTTRAALQKALLEEKIETDSTEAYPDALIVRKRSNIFQSPLFKNGLVEIQDAGSQLIAPFLKAEPGMRIIDACAGGGGKTLHLAALLQNKGKIIAMDVEAWKLEELKKRARRAGASNVEPRLIEDSRSIKRLEASADRVLLDVPCSGTGVIKRNPDAKWKLNEDFIASTRQLQSRILNEYSQMTRPGGLLVYSTCSILPSENRQQVDQFLEHQQGKFELLEEKTLLPSEGYDGFYMCLMKRL